MSRRTLKLTALWLCVCLSSCAADKTDVEYLAQAQSLYEQGKLAAAEIDAKNAVLKNVSNAPARVLLGKILLDTGDLLAAQKELTRALELGAANDAVIPLLARAMLLEGRNQDVIDMEAPRDLTADALLDLQLSRGIALLRAGYASEARFLVDEMLEESPPGVYGLSALAQLEASEGNLVKARELVQRALDIDRQDGATWSLLGQIEEGQGNLPEAKQAYRTAIETSWNKFEALYRLALLSATLGEISEATASIAEMEKLNKRSPLVPYARGYLDYRLGDLEAAAVEFDKVTTMTERFLPAIYYSGATQYRLGNMVRAEGDLRQYLAAVPADPAATKMMAGVHLANNEYAEAAALLQTLWDSDKQDPTVALTLARAYAALQRWDESRMLIEEAGALNPANGALRIELAKVFVGLGDRDAAATQLKDVLVAEPGNAEAAAVLAYVYLGAGNKQKALDTAQALIDATEGSASGYNLLGVIHLQSGQREMAEEAFQKALALAPGESSASTALAAVAVMSGDFESARNIYTSFLKLQPEHLKTLLDLAAVNEVLGDRAGAMAALEKAVKAHPEELEPRYRLGLLYQLDGRAEEVAGLVGDLTTLYPDNAALLLLLGDSAYATARYNQALVLYNKAKSLAPNHAPLLFAIARTYDRLGDAGNYELFLDKALRLDPLNSAGRVSLVKLQIASHNYEKAGPNLAALSRQNPDDIEIRVLTGLLAEREGNREKALEIYAAVQADHPSNFNLIRWALLLRNMGRQAEAEQLLLDWIAAYPADIVSSNELAVWYLNSERPDRARPLLEAVLKQDPANRLAINNLAWLLREDNPGLALEHAESAVSAAPDSISAMDTLAVILYLHGGKKNLERALKLSNRALSLNPENPAVAFHNAQIKAATGEREAAIHLLRDITEGPAFPEQAEAKKLLKSFTGR